MIFSLVNIQKYKAIPRNIQSSFMKEYKGKTYSNIIQPNLKHSNSVKSIQNYDNLSKTKIKFSTEDLDKSSQANIKTPNKEMINKNISIQKGFSTLFDNKKINKSIVSKIEHIMNMYKYNKIKLYYILIKIENFINNILNKNKVDNNDTLSFNNKSSEKINKHNNQIDKDEKKEQEIIILHKKINKLIQKQNEIEKKFKIENLNYLFCIGECQKEIAELQNKLNMKSIDKMPKKELNKIICFPNYNKFDVADEINPKSIPMYLSKKKPLLSPKLIKRNKSQKSYQDSNDFNQLFKTELKRFNLNSSYSINISNKKEDNNKNDTFENEKEENNLKIQAKGKKENEINDMIEIGKKYFKEHIPSIDKFFSGEKKYFLSHPKLNYIKKMNNGNKILRRKIVNQINSLPKQIAKLKTISISQKNTIVVFPTQSPIPIS